jgi:hypothetical protein
MSNVVHWYPRVTPVKLATVTPDNHKLKLAFQGKGLVEVDVATVRRTLTDGAGYERRPMMDALMGSVEGLKLLVECWKPKTAIDLPRGRKYLANEREWMAAVNALARLVRKDAPLQDLDALGLVLMNYPTVEMSSTSSYNPTRESALKTLAESIAEVTDANVLTAIVSSTFYVRWGKDLKLDKVQLQRAHFAALEKLSAIVVELTSSMACSHVAIYSSDASAAAIAATKLIKDMPHTREHVRLLALSRTPAATDAVEALAKQAFSRIALEEVLDLSQVSEVRETARKLLRASIAQQATV